MRVLVVLLICVTAFSCSPVSCAKLTKSLRAAEQKFQAHSGLIVLDLDKNKTVFEYKADRYFAPGSNTKILTFLTALSVLGDSIPALRYRETNDSLIVWGMGDPSFLNHLCHSNDRTYRFFSGRQKNIYLSFANFQMPAFGPGWAWDDYNEDFSQELSAFPIYGNSFQVVPLPDKLLVVPSFFRKYMRQGPSQKAAAISRNVFSNEFTYHPGTEKRFNDFLIPFRADQKFIADLLTDTLHRKVTVSPVPYDSQAKTLYSVPADSLFKVMMQQSDNHIAEQLLMMCAAVLTDTLDSKVAIRYMLKNKLNDYPDRIIWKDGSGLSRYNLFTPRTVLRVWQQIAELKTAEDLYPLLATGGKSGTLKKFFKSDNPYVFGKTGTLSNNHSLSGFLETRKGHRLLFAFMNSNYVSPVANVRAEMEKILNLFYENY